MSVVEEPYYCHEQIEIPPALPDIMKQFTKAAIRTQPKDPLEWSYEALANKDVPPVKERLEMPISSQKNDTGLTPGMLRILNNQLGTTDKQSSGRVLQCKVEEKWLALALPLERLQEIWRIGNFGQDVKWLHFLSLAATQIAPSLAQTLCLLCELLTSEKDNASPPISFDLFCEIYRYLGTVDPNLPSEHIEQIIQNLTFEAQQHCGRISKREFLRFNVHPNQCNI
ncbi:unnamed protein product [Schistocephalus solidus]|uniref:Mediator of RNA polymerase II transcription subunit 24 n=1 Tax=Schistocephalus solidus TaxID=70667 RepID=A0A183TDS3_SCHSO|nr:unnamed protein product [Schistocephalus solidus]